MRRSKFLALAMCCAFFAGMPVKAMKDSPAKSGNRNKVLDSAVNLVKENPIKSLLALFGVGLFEEGIRHVCKRSKSSEIKSNTQINNKVPGLPKVQIPLLPKAPVTDVNDILKGFKFRQPGYKSYLKLVGDLNFFPKSFKNFINSKKDELRSFFDSGFGHYFAYGKPIFLSDEVVDDILNSEGITGKKLTDEEKALIKDNIIFAIIPSQSSYGDYLPNFPGNKYLEDSGNYRSASINLAYLKKEYKSDLDNFCEKNYLFNNKTKTYNRLTYLIFLCDFDYDEMKKCDDITIFDDVKEYWKFHSKGKTYVF
jgi:hypothetical protein